ncbi:MAG TPA: lantibiotic dehydratase, partial [Blastocatellia bacterium]|nr:lantibiotic dehydratase [Blastocatellia bacterium]
MTNSFLEKASRGDLTATGTTRDSRQLPEHLERLPGGEWCLWRWAGLRGAGFAASEVLKLAAPACAAAADEVLRAEEEAENVWKIAFDAVDRQVMLADEQSRPLLEKAKRRLQKGKPPDVIDLAPGLAEPLNAFAAALVRVDDAWDDFHEAFDKGGAEVSEAIQEIARSNRFREAITWQNRHALHTAVDPILRKSPAGARGSKQRQHEELIASYLQRYGLKNDTIGFFGPMGWARIVSEGKALTARPGQSLTATRRVYFDGWCIDALAETLSSDPEMRPWIAPRRSALTCLEGDTLWQFQKAPFKLSAEQAALLRAIDGKRVAKEIAGQLLNDPSLRVKTEEEVYSMIDRLCDEGAVSWKLQTPCSPGSEVSLRGRLERIGEDGLRGRSLEALGELERARDAAEAAAGDAARVDEAMA